MTKSRAKRLLSLESKWVCGGGKQGRNKGKNRKGKKQRAHHSRLERLRKAAE